ncbi:hypothetical protein ACJJTC_010439 [Scirpophaga incertulas]
MSRKDSNVDVTSYIDTEYSSGDSNRTVIKQHYQEENNNEVNELSKELSEMGCIVDAVKRPPNICVETCVYDTEGEKRSHAEEDAYSDEFEDDKSDDEESMKSIKIKPQSLSNVTKSDPPPSSIKLTKSHSSLSHKSPGSISGRSTGDYGSISLQSTRRINMSFTNDRLREIERHNHILLTKILSVRNGKKSSIPSSELRRPLPSSAVMRKNQQRQIDRENMILLKKIQRAKSSVPTLRR